MLYCFFTFAGNILTLEHFHNLYKQFSNLKYVNMKYIKFETVFILVAFGIFTYQMIDAINEYIYPPVVYIKKQINLDDVEMPRIYVCELNQFNYTIANSFGYKYNTDYVIGEMMDSDSISWNGNSSLKPTKLMEKLYQLDQENLPSVNTETELIFIQPSGYCQEVTKLESTIKVLSTVETKVYIVDPQTDNDIRIELIDPEADFMEITPTFFGTFEDLKLFLTLEIYDDSIQDGETCTNYQKISSSYGDCMYLKTKYIFSSILGCLPPWFPGKESEKCTNAVTNLEEESQQKFQKLAKKMYRREPLNDFDCKSSCVKMKVSARKMYHKKNYLERGKITLTFDEKVIVQQLTPNYKFFDLITELGSALGLWLGLSVLSLLDGFTVAANLFQRLKK